MSEPDISSIVSSSTKMLNSTLSSMPTDVLTEIITSCFPLDIISIRRTCKILLETSRQRTIWIAVVRRICSQQDIIIATFPVETFTLIQMEQVAIAPWRIRSLFMMSGSEQPIQPIEIYEEKRGFKQAHLVSGGRFLLTISTSEMLQLWDLGFVWNAMPDWRLLASVQQRNDFMFCVDALPATTGTGLLHVVLKKIRSPLYEVYRIDPWSSFPQFHLSGNLELNGLISDSNSFSCARGMYILHCDRGPVLWNWEQDSWIQFPFDNVILASRACQTHLVLLHPAHLSLWAIPDELPHRVASQSVPIAIVEPLAYISFPGSFALSHVVWREALPTLQFDIVQDSSFGLRLYQFSFTMDGRQISPDNGTSNHPLRHSSLWRPIRSDLLIDKIFWIPPSDHFMVVWYQLFGADAWNGKIHGQLILRSEETGNFSSERLVEFTPVFDPATLCRLWFDPFSGRACALLTDERIVIMDYLGAPNVNA